MAWWMSWVMGVLLEGPVAGWVWVRLVSAGGMADRLTDA